MLTHVLLLDEGTALAFVGIIAILAVCLLSLALVALVFLAWRRNEQPHAAPLTSAVPAPVAVPGSTRRASLARNRPGDSHIENVEIDVPTRHADAIIHALQSSGWLVRETGDVVATDDDEEGLTTISVDVPSPTQGSRPSTGEEIQ